MSWGWLVVVDAGHTAGGPEAGRAGGLESVAGSRRDWVGSMHG